MNQFNKILIAGKLPLPIGGVRIHVERLVQQLPDHGFTNYDFFNFEQKPILYFFLEILKYRAVHLHTSNTWLQLLISTYCFILRKVLVITYHGNWGRFSSFRNLSARISAKLASVPILQNEESLATVKKINKNAILISSFIPPVEVKPLTDAQFAEIHSLKKRFRNIFCTNAWDVTFDSQGREIYGIFELIKQMQTFKNAALIISDPSGNYQAYARKSEHISAENVLWLSEPHDFVSVLNYADAFIRNTTTDGMSISIQEALWRQIPVFASDVVSRAPGCHLYRSVTEVNIEKELEKIQDNPVAFNNSPDTACVVEELIQIYGRYLC